MLSSHWPWYNYILYIFKIKNIIYYHYHALCLYLTFYIHVITHDLWHDLSHHRTTPWHWSREGCYLDHNTSTYSLCRCRLPGVFSVLTDMYNIDVSTHWYIQLRIHQLDLNTTGPACIIIYFMYVNLIQCN